MLHNIRTKVLLGSFALALTMPAWAFLWTYTDNACGNFYWAVPDVQAYHAWKTAKLVASYIDSGDTPPICMQ